MCSVDSGVIVSTDFVIDIDNSMKLPSLPSVGKGLNLLHWLRLRCFRLGLRVKNGINIHLRHAICISNQEARIDKTLNLVVNEITLLHLCLHAPNLSLQLLHLHHPPLCFLL